LTYVLIEPSEARGAWQQETLAAFEDKIVRRPSLEDLGNRSVDGIIFCNELLDSMPAHRFGWDRDGGRWFEWGVDLDGRELRAVRMPHPSLPVPAAMKAGGFDGFGNLLEVLPDGFTLETSPAAAAWWGAAAGALRRGRLMTLDYGGESGELMAPHRHDGTFRAYSRHHLAANPLAQPGEQDLTTHVNFSVLMRVGAEAGLTTETYQSQEAFLTGIFRAVCDSNSGFGPWTPKRTRQFQTLTHPEHLGRAFRVLVQGRG
jgi:SAM-dependent MidA family methyltransferase